MKKVPLLAALVLGWSCLVATTAIAAERFFDSAGVKIRYLDEGRGEPVILVHGYSDQELLSSQILRLWPNDKPQPSQEELRAISSQRLAGKDHIALAAVRRSNQDQVLTAESLGRTGVPILAMVGSNDTVQKNVVGLKEQLPAVQLVMIEGASHGSAPASPRFISALKAFLQAHPLATKAP